ncbi:hypothetical protein [Actinoplanes sp. G11-F43]|uniref:hypothetical protein n=1 Tax=Actinoplanes sp. G11-F43 TaxID=3424130 RepID=UPI003D33DB8F
MTGALRAEVIKLITLPALAVTAVLIWVATGLLRLADPPGGVLAYSQVGVLVLGALAAGQEFQGGGQIRASLLAVPRRTVLMVTKFTATAVVGGAVALVAAGLAGEPRGAGRLLSDLLLAVGVGLIVRHPMGATGALLIGSQIGLPLARPHLPAGVLAVPPWAWTSMIILVAAVALQRREA